MTQHLKKYAEYIVNTGQAWPKIAHFDEDWEPVGPMVREQMRSAGLTLEDSGVIILTSEGMKFAAGGLVAESLLPIDSTPTVIPATRPAKPNGRSGKAGTQT